MKKIIILWLAFAATLTCKAQAGFNVKTYNSADGKYSYTMVENDPLKVRTYKLKNGLTVMLSVNNKEPRVQTFIAVKAGSKNDPSDNTGLAHYLEHMLFKGTDKYGTKDWAKEKVYLDQIDALYEVYNKTTDEKKRKLIYKQIDSVSSIASKFAIANEYDKLVQNLGAKGTNAFTSLEQTVYVNDIPQNNIDRWLTVEAERFRNPILRLFHTELEAVYEEKNISLDNDGRKVFEAMMKGLFKQHTYGTQTTIGTVEHLKNPSLIKIRNYFNTYYVPNNMAIILAGDIDPDKTIALIDKNFGYMEQKTVPSFSFKPEIPKLNPEITEVFGPDAENMMLGYRLPGAGTPEARMLTITDMLLSNSKAGLIDLNLTKLQKVLGAGSMSWVNKDYSLLLLTGRNKQDQSLEQVKDLLLEQLNEIKKGNFSETTLKGIIANLKVDKIKEQESNQGRAYAMLDAFTLDRPWQDAAADLDALSKITKQQIVEFANKYFTNDYVVVYKRSGVDKNVVKIDKPQITPVSVNREDVSPFVKNILETKAPKIEPKFVDFNKEMTISSVGSSPIYYVKNNDNDLFKLYYVLDMGKFNDLKLPMAVNLLQYLGTDNYTPNQISEEFFNLACDYGVSVNNEQAYVYLSGLNENFVPALKLFEHLLANAKPDQEALNNLIERILKSKKDNKKNKGLIFRTALQQYATYGPNNPFTHELSEAQLKALKAEDLVNNYIKKLNQYQHKIWYNGPLTLTNLTGTLAKEHKMAKKPLAYPKAVEFTYKETNKNQVLFVNYDMVQAEIMWLNKSIPSFDSTLNPVVSLFNEYFGGGMSSVVFQTIRESKALAYSTYSRFNSPSKKNNPYFIVAYVGTQADKLNEAVPAMNELLNNLPKSENMFNAAKESLSNVIETNRTNDLEIIFAYENAKKLGVHHNLSEDIYKALPTMTFDDINRFHTTFYQNKPFTYCVMGSSSKIKKEDLSKFGEVIEVTLEEIFGY